MIWVGFTGWAGVVLPDGPNLLCRMGRVGFARWPDWLCRVGRASFVIWSVGSLPDGPDWLCWMHQVALPNVIAECGMGTWERVATWDQ